MRKGLYFIFGDQRRTSIGSVVKSSVSCIMDSENGECASGEANTKKKMKVKTRKGLCPIFGDRRRTSIGSVVKSSVSCITDSETGSLPPVKETQRN
jgi:hypothetical protein